MLEINEIFYSIQGEGRFIGLPMTFIRVTGCNLRCKWWDTKYAYSDGEEWSSDDIINKIKTYPTKNVCITGGEPLMQKEIDQLINQLLNHRNNIFLETNGSIFIGGLPSSDSIHISLDIKCPSSGEHQKMNFTNFELLKDSDQVKFIIADINDYNYAKGIIQEYLISHDYTIIFTPCDQPQEIVDDENTNDYLDLPAIVDLVLKDGLNVHVLPQLHKILWPNVKRGV